MKYAIIKICGKQYKVSEGEEILVEKLEAEKGEAVVFDEVLLLANEKTLKIGQPLVEKAKVKAKVLEQVKGEKIRVAKFRSKSKYRKVKGHRQRLTKIKIEKIYGKDKK
ncbi:50S ribosomal protein L21 [Candidatus Microgenomates bacterium]|nr:50S ribosomal protein L21 [Candidatus Microgenomates bacterium]